MKRVLLLAIRVCLILVGQFALMSSGAAQNQCCNILTNGDFELGDVGFTSDLNQDCACIANSYCVGTNFQSKCSGWPNMADHTSGSGNFLIMDGNPSLPVDVWSTTVNLVPGVTHCFSFWAANVYSNTFDLGLAVDGLLVPGAVFTVQPGPIWTQFSFSWVASSGNSIAIRQLTGGGERDFGIDDIEFGMELLPGFNWQPDVTCGMKINFTNQSAGPSPLTYAWNFGEPASPSNTSNLEDPMHTYDACNDFEVCLTVSHDQCSAQYCEMVSAADLEPPAIFCPPDVIVQASLPDCEMVVYDIGLFSATDNCGTPDVVYNITGATAGYGPYDASGLSFQKGISTVTYTATDLCGNSTDCSFDVEVQCPSCDCKDIEMVIQSFSKSMDTCCYQLTFDNGQGGCFPSIHLQVDAGLFITGWNTILPGWSVVQINPQYIEVLPPNAYLPFGSFTPITFCVTGGAVHDMIVFTGYEENMMNVECSKPFSFDCSMSDPCIADISFQEDSCGWFTFTGYANNTTGSVTYTWDFGDNTTGSGSTISHHYLSAGTYTVILTITDQAGCMASYTVQVTVPVLPSVSVTTNQPTICLGQSTTIVASGSAGNVYSWSSGGSGNTITLTPATVGTYSYTVTAQLNGCTATATQVVDVLSCDCEGSLLTNGNFSIGQPGSLPFPGNALGWSPIYSPQMVMSDGYLTPGCMQMWGNQVVGEGIVQAANFQPGCSYEISFAAKVFPTSGPQPVQLRLRATNGPFIVGSNPPNYLNCPTGTCEQILFSGPLTNNWAWYGPFSWTATNSSLNNLVATVWNNSSQQDPYETSWLRFDSLCIQKEFCPNECTCGVFSETGFGYEKGPFIATTCDSMAITPVLCPNPNQGFWFSGMLTCSGTNCAASTPVEWELWYTSSGSPYMIANNVTQASPWFGIVLNESYFVTGGVYELRLKGKCGTNDCICVVSFEMPPCQNKCPCDETDFKKDVSAGFYSATVISQCRACFTPGKLKDCDLVEWTISPLDSNYINPLGTTSGRQQYCFSFPKGGLYTVEMHVSRICPNGIVLDEVFSKKIYIKCTGGEDPSCNSSLDNPDFKDVDAVSLANSKASEGWIAIAGSPQVIDSSKSVTKDRDGWYIALSGNNDTSDALSTDMPKCMNREGTILIRAAADNGVKPEGKRRMVFVDLVQGDMWSINPCEGNDCYEVACLEFPEDADGWVDFTFDYDLSQIFVTDSCGSSMEDNVPFRPVISIGNRLSNEQGDPAETKSTVLLSFVCTADSSLTATESPKISTQFHLFPNPTSGTITLVLPEYATKDITFRVVGLAGNVVLEQPATSGSLQQTIQTDGLPTGLYFVQVLSKGSQLWIERFVKQ